MILKVPYYQLQVVNVNQPPVKVLVYNKKVKFDAKNLNEMANHLIGKKLSVYRENVYDVDGDGKVTLKDFIQRIKDVDKG